MLTQFYKLTVIFVVLLFTITNTYILPAQASDELRFSFSQEFGGMSCIRTEEPADPAPWSDNYLCTPLSSQGAIRWSYAGPLAGMRCTQINEPADPDTWSDNYLCVDKDFPVEFRWSYAGTDSLEGLKIISFNEPADPDSWGDNYLGWKIRELPGTDARATELYNQSLSTGSPARTGSCSKTGGCEIIEASALPTFRQVQEWIKRVGQTEAGKQARVFGAVAQILKLTADDPRTIEREKRDARLRDFDQGKYDRGEGGYRDQIDRDAKEVAREHGCRNC